MDIYRFFEIIEDDADIEEYVHYINRPRRLPQFRERQDYFTMWNDEEFFVRFRISKVAVQRVVDEVCETIVFPTERNNAVSPMVMVLLTLRFFATGSFLIVLGDFVGIHKSTVSKIIHKVSRAIAHLHWRYIRMPQTEEEVTSVRQNFYSKARFPRCIGAVDCTHVKIISPGGGNAETFRNRKGTVCGPDLKILDVVARWPGSAHDSTIFNNSNIRGRFERGEMGDSLIVGDSGYGVRKYLITPLSNPVTPAEQLFNESQIRTRNPVERSYGVWKRRFPILALGIRLSLERVEAIIVATAVLHNIACDMREKEPLENEDIEAAVVFVNNVNDNIQHNNVVINNITRNSLIRNYFQRLV